MDVDELLLIAISHGNNEDGSDGVVGISDEVYAAELQLQELIMSSAMAATAAAAADQLDSGSAVHASSEDAAAAAHAKTSPSSALVPAAECSSSSAAAMTLVASVVKCSCSSSAMAPSATTTSFLFCKICMDDVPASDAHRGSHGCAHAFCAACLAGHIAAKLHSGGGVYCPEDGCASAVDPELCQPILPEDNFERWCAALCRAMVLGGRHVYCPFTDCAEIIADERGGDSDGQPTECPACRRRFCERCGVAWHGGVSCGEYGELAVGDRGEGDLAVVEMAKGSRWRRCPRCKFFVDRYEGCSHITCRCGLEFCYGCGQEWGPTGHSSYNEIGNSQAL
uniref:RBR-type E3 ubiquitin transferase n=1 Tax=Oryza rufipogon TaxID=4529 RepID=A0A0E0QP44_ORYRU